jgi:phage shock protein PspC (stress-responsive transcriptional regulator)
MDHRLYRSRDNSIVAGVCGGLGAYLGIDPTFVRIFFILLAWSNGLGLLVYLLLWIIVPRQDRPRTASLGEAARDGADEIARHARAVGEEFRQAVQNPHPRAAQYIGIGLIIFGVITLLGRLQVPWLGWLEPEVIWPVLLIMAGLAILIRRWKGD